MKKIYLILLMMVALASCHNQDWEFPDSGLRTVYFSNQFPVRVITLGEDPEVDNSLDNEHKCKIMATTGGGYSNNNNIAIGIEVDNSLCENLQYKGTADPVLPMPSEYYSLSSDKIEISSGKIIGGVEVQLTDAFFADPLSIKNTYVIPVRMTDVHNADSILQGRPLISNPNICITSDWDIVPKNYVLYCVKYINPWHATYLRRGKDVVIGKSGHESLSKTIVRHNQYVEKDEVCNMVTRSMKEVTLSLNAKDETGNEIPYVVILQFDDEGRCSVKSDSENYTITGNGKFVVDGDKKSWGNEDRDVIYLDYTVELPDLATYHTLDTLVVRDRGVVMETFAPELQ